MAKRTRHYPEGQYLYVAYPGLVQKVAVVARGTAGYVFKKNKKKDPYVVENVGGSAHGERYVIESAELHEDPLSASRASGVAFGEQEEEEDLEDNPIGGDDDEEEDYEEEDDEGFDEDDEAEEDEESDEEE